MKKLFATYALTSLIVPHIASAHGWVTSPPSRQDLCARDKTGFDCGQVKWEPQSVEGAKGSLLCSGGGRFDALDFEEAWPSSKVSQTQVFQWHLTAQHRTRSWEYFVDGEKFASFDGKLKIPAADVKHTLTKLPLGLHTILARWNVADTNMAFYSCVDINVEEDSPKEN